MLIPRIHVAMPTHPLLSCGHFGSPFASKKPSHCLNEHQNGNEPQSHLLYGLLMRRLQHRGLLLMESIVFLFNFKHCQQLFVCLVIFFTNEYLMFNEFANQWFSFARHASLDDNDVFTVGRSDHDIFRLVHGVYLLTFSIGRSTD